MSRIAEKKTVQTRFGVIEIPKSHILCSTPLGFKMTPYWQEKCVYMGQQNVFEEAEQIINKLTGQNVGAKQIERLVHSYGGLLEQKQSQEEPLAKNEKPHYGMMDGGMILTREDDWKEMKLARIFSVESHIETEKSKNLITQSHYIAHLGGHQPFFRKVEKYTDVLPNMVWIGDGAKWIWDWVSGSYCGATQILDFYHAKERLCLLAAEVFTGSNQRKRWVDEQENHMLKDGFDEMIGSIEKLRCKGKALQLQRSALTYYENNRSRMRYKDYLDKGLLIGSGPIEAAHRHVIQIRMKRSGQRWTLKGAQQIANLRTAYCSGQWDTVKNLICTLNLN